MKLKMFFATMICIIFFVFTILMYRSVKEEMTSEDERVVITAEMRENCLTCHKEKYTENVFRDWKQSKHSKQGIGCELCHLIYDQSIKNEIEQIRVVRGMKKSQCQDERVNNIVTPAVCAMCHKKQYEEFKDSNHGKAFQNLQAHLDLNGDNKYFKQDDCQKCHQVEYKCSSCHSRHKFSLSFARKPETCSICHSGERHPQTEQYFSTLHGLTYQAEGNEWDWEGSIKEWHKNQKKQPHTVPLCITCHMVGGSHNSRKPERLNNFEWLCTKCHVSNNAVNFAMIDHSSNGAKEHAQEISETSNNFQCKICHKKTK